MRIVYDSDVVLDYFLKRQPGLKGSTAITLLALLRFEQGCLMSNSVADMHYLLAQELGNLRAQFVVEEILKEFRVIPVEEDDLTEALSKRWDDLQACLMSVCAKKVHSHFIITRNIRNFRQSKVTTLTPEEYFSWCDRNNIHYHFSD